MFISTLFLFIDFRLEEVAEKLNLSMEQVIVNNCCPLVPVAFQDEVKTEGCPLVPTSHNGKLVLNYSQRIASQPGHPEVSVRDILDSLLQKMKGIAFLFHYFSKYLY